ncbi:NAD/NADP-dependent octopine/nopaline dehydrogenase family protein [Virgibacillus halodenitrificans]|uniref:NAD/NADP-dependent octopine/nopaline dehydrogenase family protein n=1 Tax=Virgibacillus halodenitrificans TaxID=1482 RepID=UPI002DB59DEA|nr:NAD/NADP octopine/nopaline dehydrogenase family protein [Virgibacillus halodenitrificans]MEC2159746.1 NAD/NADP octopine/nopaline dehydrogenase family protein [Virgibacillus halodenitrificans]
MKYAVVGGGNTGQAIASYLALNKEKVKLYTRNAERAERISRNGLEIKGVYSGYINLEVHTSIEEVIQDTEIIIISTTADGHKPIIRKLKPLLKNDQTIVFIPGYWAAVECKQILGKDIENKNITIAETNAQPFISDADDEGRVWVRKIKNNVLVSTLATSKGQLPLSSEFLSRFPHLVPSKNIFETSLNNSNVVIHVPISLFNASRIDDSQEFLFYPEGISPLVVRYIEKVDEERRKIADLFHVETKNILTILNDFYGTSYSTLYEALPSLFPAGAGPTTFKHRYFTEDIPFGLVAISEVAKKADIDLPYTNSLIDIASLLSTVDYRKEGVNFGEITFEELSSYGGLTEKV